MSTKTKKSLVAYERDTKLELIVDAANSRVGLWVSGTEVIRLTTTGIAPLVDMALTGDIVASGGDLDLGSSGVAGTLDVFPTTAAKGKLSISAADSAGDTTTAIVNASQAGSRTYTIPDAGASASFVMTAGAQTLGGVKTFSSMPKWPVNSPVAGAGTVIGDAAPLLTGITVITGANGTVGWILPVTTGGDVVILKGTTAGVAKLWPQSGGQINAVGTSTAMSLASGVIPVILVSISATQWYTLPLLPS